MTRMPTYIPHSRTDGEENRGSRDSAASIPIPLMHNMPMGQLDLIAPVTGDVEVALTGKASDKATRHVDGRNTLNDLAGHEWLPETKSFFFQKGLGADHAHTEIERQHPAPFSFQDIARLVGFFTKSGHTVLDPFAGVGSTAKACALLGRKSIGIELSKRWHELSQQRLRVEAGLPRLDAHRLILGDARVVMPTLRPNSVDFVVTSPPYWAILNKKPDHKSLERVRRELATTYSTDKRDLGNMTDYGAFVDELVGVFLACGRVLKSKRYMAIIVSDFRHGTEYYSFHSDLIQRLKGAPIRRNSRLELQGVKVLLQNHKSLKPYGYPFAYVENVHHQYILIFRKQASAA